VSELGHYTMEYGFLSATLCLLRSGLLNKQVVFIQILDKKSFSNIKITLHSTLNSSYLEAPHEGLSGFVARTVGNGVRAGENCGRIKAGLGSTPPPYVDLLGVICSFSNLSLVVMKN